MSRIISTSTTPVKAVQRQTIRRTRRVCIEAKADGTYFLTAEREDLFTIDGEIVSTKPAPSVVIADAEIKAHKDLAVVQMALVQAIDDKEQAIEDAAADVEPIVVVE